MLRRFALAAMVLAGVGIAAGSAPLGELGGGGHPLRALAAKLNLTDQQKAEIRKIIKDAREELHHAHGLLQKIRVLRHAWERIKAVLTPQQLQILEGLRKAHHGFHGNFGGQGPGQNTGAAQPGGAPTSNSQ